MVGLGLGVYGMYLESLALFYLLVGVIGASGVRRGLARSHGADLPKFFRPKHFITAEPPYKNNKLIISRFFILRMMLFKLLTCTAFQPIT